MMSDVGWDGQGRRKSGEGFCDVSTLCKMDSMRISRKDEDAKTLEVRHRGDMQYKCA